MNTAHNLTYNTEKADLIISEYGRHIQKMTEYVCNIEDKEKRQRAAEYLIKLMNQLNPQKSTDDYTSKLWKHLLRISDYKLDVDFPEGINPERVDLKAKRVQLGYPEENNRYRHYGKYVQALVEKICNLEEGEKKKEFIYHLGSFMKQAYANSSRNQDVSDEMIIADIKTLSKGKIKIEDNVQFADVSYSPNNQRKSNNKRRPGRKKRK